MRILGAGLPNFTGWFTGGNNNGHVVGVDNKLFYKNGHTSYAASASANDATQIWIDPSRVNSIYGAANTVQPPAISLLPQIKY